MPSTGQIVLLARDREGDLQPGQKTITLESLLKKIVVSGPKEVNRGGKVCELTLHFADKDNRHQKAEWDRWIELSSTAGHTDPQRVLIPKDKEHAEVSYHSPDSVGDVTITGESRGLDSGQWILHVVTAAYVLVLFAGLGGVLGGFVRLVHKGQVRHILPGRAHGRLELGLLGNTALSSVFGLVLFQAAKLGFLGVSEVVPKAGSVETGTRTFAFFFGVLGEIGRAHV